MARRYWIFLPFVLFLSLLGAGLMLNPRELPSALVGKAVPDFELPMLIGNRLTVSPSDFRQQVWVLNVWASWCVACQSEHDVLLRQKLPENVPLVGLNYKDDTQNAIDWLRRMGGNPYHAIAKDEKGRAGMDLGVYAVPETFVIDRQGRIVHRIAGALDEATFQNVLLPKVREALKS